MCTKRLKNCLFYFLKETDVILRFDIAHSNAGKSAGNDGRQEKHDRYGHHDTECWRTHAHSIARETFGG